MRPIYFNGKLYAGGVSGVRRVADRLIREVDARLAELPAAERPEATLFLPKRRQWQPTLTTIRIVEEPRGDSQLWEQLVLPIRARGGLLVNLCNLAPVLHTAKVLMLHDVQFLFPDSSYPARLRWGYRLLTPLMARTSEQVLTVSAYSRQMLDLCGVAPRDRTEVLYNGAEHMLDAAPDPDVIGRLGLKPGRFVVHLASPKAYKNTAVIFNAFADPRLADLGLVLVGPDRGKLSRAGLEAPERSVFAGAVDDAGLRALYEAALCLAFPSRTEGFGLPPIEAMACGCPAVVSAGGAIPEVCRDAVLYADVDRPNAWVEAFRSLADDPDRRQAKILAGRRRAADFTWEASGRALTVALLRAAKASPGRLAWLLSHGRGFAALPAPPGVADPRGQDRAEDPGPQTPVAS